MRTAKSFAALARIDQSSQRAAGRFARRVERVGGASARAPGAVGLDAHAFAATAASHAKERRRTTFHLALMRVAIISIAALAFQVIETGSWLLAYPAIATLAFGLPLRLAYSARVLPRAVGAGFKTALGLLLGLPALLAAGVLLPAAGGSPFTIVMTAVVVALLWVRAEEMVSRSSVGRQRVLVVGRSGGGALLAKRLAADPGDFDLVGLQDIRPNLGSLSGVQTFDCECSIAQLVAERNPTVIVLADEGPGEGVIEGLLDMGALGIRVVSLPAFYEYAFACVPILDISSRWFMTALDLRQPRYAAATKRAFDLTIVTLALVVVGPLLPILAGVVWLTSPGPIFFKQRRVGEGGRIFKIVKFRTMKADAEAHGAAIWATANDPRVTVVGHLLRRSHLDELPQLWNIFRGEMSVVGPRPERPEFVSLLEEEIPFWMRRTLMRPGLTGWAQVGHGYTSDTDEAGYKLSMDLWYLNHQSLILDFAIVATTMKVGVLGLLGRSVDSATRGRYRADRDELRLLSSTDGVDEPDVVALGIAD